ncbi:hypothetical protein [Vasconcelosia minhoensis]|uniref:hypothetical protein n=1 Tax=Vasconcelosia minhoensis TaxID=3366354 RepID=UPI001D14D114|nr:hypothetical protein [Romeria gracilis]
MHHLADSPSGNADADRSSLDDGGSLTRLQPFEKAIQSIQDSDFAEMACGSSTQKVVAS